MIRDIEQKISALLHDTMRKLHEIRAEPEAVAGGVAIGMFLGFTPFVGFKTLLALLLAWMTRCSKIAAVIAVTLHDVLIVIAPFMLWLEFKIGNLVLQRPHATLFTHTPPEPIPGHHFLNLWLHWSSYFNWTYFSWDFVNTFIIPVLIGSIIVAIPCAIASYFITHTLLLRMRRRHLAAEEAARAIGAAVDPNDI